MNKLVIDMKNQLLTVTRNNEDQTLPLYSKEGFELVSDAWLKIGWNEKYVYSFSWMGRPIIQLPEDIIRIQEVIYNVKPDVIIETGVAHGGSLILYASLFKAMGRGRVIGVDIEIRKHNRDAIEAHELSPYITLIEGDSTSEATVDRVRKLVKPDERVLVILDSCHTKDHVAKELMAYREFVTPGSYIVATDGSMKDLYDVPRGTPSWKTDNPTAAALEFASKDRNFVSEEPVWPFNESKLNQRITHWPSAYLRRV